MKIVNGMSVLALLTLTGCQISQARPIIVNDPQAVTQICGTELGESNTLVLKANYMISFRYPDETYESYFLGEKEGKILIPQTKKIIECQLNSVILPNEFKKLEGFSFVSNNQFEYKGDKSVIRVVGLDKNGKKQPGVKLLFEVVHPGGNLLIPGANQDMSFFGFEVDWTSTQSLKKKVAYNTLFPPFAKEQRF